MSVAFDCQLTHLVVSLAKIVLLRCILVAFCVCVLMYFELLSCAHICSQLHSAAQTGIICTDHNGNGVLVLYFVKDVGIKRGLKVSTVCNLASKKLFNSDDSSAHLFSSSCHFVSWC